MAGIPPLKGTAHTEYLSLGTFDDANVFKTSPTLAAGDVQVSKDGGAFANITSLPTQIGSTGVLAVALTSTEMNADVIVVRFHDAAGDEWQDLLVTIETETVQISDLATSADLATIDGVVDAIKLKTDLIPADPAETSDIPSAADITDAVWDELLAGHADPGSTGEALSASGSSSDPLLNQVPGTYAAGTAGAALGHVGSGQIVTVSPVAQDGAVETIQGDDYSAASGRAIEWTDVSAGWPDLTDATVQVIIGGIVEMVGSVVTPSGSGKKLRLVMTDLQTAAIRVGAHPFQVIVTLSSDEIVTLVDAVWTSRRRLAA